MSQNNQQTVSEIEINGVIYGFDSMPVLTQFHVLRRLAPLVSRLPAIVSAMGPTITDEGSPGKEGKSDSPSGEDPFDMSLVIQPVVDGLAEMGDKEAEFVIYSCLRTVRRRVEAGGDSNRGGAGWVRAWNSAANQPQFADMDLLIILQLVFRVLMDFAAPFSSVLASRRP